MNCTSEDNSVHGSIVRFICEHFDLVSDVDSPDPKFNEPILRVTVRFYKIIIKPFDGQVVDIVEGFHAFFFASN